MEMGQEEGQLEADAEPDIEEADIEESWDGIQATKVHKAGRRKPMAFHSLFEN